MDVAQHITGHFRDICPASLLTGTKHPKLKKKQKRKQPCHKLLTHVQTRANQTKAWLKGLLRCPVYIKNSSLFDGLWGRTTLSYSLLWPLDPAICCLYSSVCGNCTLLLQHYRASFCICFTFFFLLCWCGWLVCRRNMFSLNYVSRFFCFIIFATTCAALLLSQLSCITL